MNLRMRKVSSALLAIVLIPGILNGCIMKSITQKESKVVKVSLALEEEELAIVRKEIIPQFEKQNNAKVEIVQTDKSEVNKKIEAMKKEGKSDIDLIAVDINSISELASKGLFEDLTSSVGIMPKETIGILSDIGKVQDKTYFVPYRPKVEINYYHDIRFRRYGLKAPRTWEELLNASKFFRDTEGIGRVALNIDLSEKADEVVELIKQAGGDPLVLNDEGTVRAYTYLKQLWPYLSQETVKANSNSINKLMAEEEIVYAPNTLRELSVLIKDGGKKEIKANSGYSGPNGAYKILRGEVIGIPAGSPNKDLSVKFIQYIMSKEVQQIFVTKLGWPSFRRDAYGKIEDWQTTYFESVQEALTAAKPLPEVSYWPEVNKAINEALKEIVIDNKGIKPTLDKYAAVVQKVKADYEKIK